MRRWQGVVADGAASAVYRQVPAEGAVDDGELASVADGAAIFRDIVDERAVDDHQGAGGAVVDSSAVAEDVIPLADVVSGDDAVGDDGLFEPTTMTWLVAPPPSMIVVAAPEPRMFKGWAMKIVS